MGKPILGESQAIKNLIKMIERLASARTNILVTGESGTGKELVARMIHDFGPLKDKPFVPVNCGAIPENLIESELFGHKKGSFTGAVMDKQGLFEVANGGSIFLDEVGELPLGMQVKLLRVIQERSFRKVGGTDDVKVEVRIIAATNKDLEKQISEGKFREDLFYRLNVIMLKTPPLRQREGDVRILAEHFLKQFATRFNSNVKGFEPDVLAVLENYDWPGNVRELENAIERGVALESGKKVSLQSLPAAIVASAISDSKIMASAAHPMRRSGDEADEASGGHAEDIRIPAPDFSKGKIPIDEILGKIERTYLMAALHHTGGVKKKAADLLGITFRSIRYRLKKLGVRVTDEEGE